MPSIYDLKPQFQALLRPLVRRLANYGVTANQVTVSAAVLSIGVGAWVAATEGARAALLAVPITLLVRMALNAIDGMLAREHQQQSRLGAILNEVGDVVADAALYLPLALVPGVPAVWVVLAVVLAVVSELVGVLGLQVGSTRRYDGPMGKSDRAFVFGAVCLALGLGAPTGPWLSGVLGFVVLLLVATIANRGRRALSEGTKT